MTSEKITSLYDELLAKSAKESLSKLLPTAFRVSNALNDNAFSKWARLEMNGYLNTNQAYTDDVEVPKYREIKGKHVDAYGKSLKGNQKVKGISNKTRICESIDTIEELSAKEKSVYIEDHYNMEILKENPDIDTLNFKLEPAELTGVTKAIRTKLTEWLEEIKPSIGKYQDNIFKKSLKAVVSFVKNWTWYKNPKIIIPIGAVVLIVLTAVITAAIVK